MHVLLRADQDGDRELGVVGGWDPVEGEEEANVVASTAGDDIGFDGRVGGAETVGAVGAAVALGLVDVDVLGAPGSVSQGVTSVG